MIRAAYEKGARDAFARLGVKEANIPTAQVVPTGSGVRTPPPAAAAAAPGRMAGMMRPVRRALGLTALGAGGALAYGMHRQHVDDRERHRDLVYAPLPGSVMG